MDNPYSPTPIVPSAPNQPFLKAILQRFAAISLYVVGWICIGVITMSVFTRIAGEMPSARTPETELTKFESFSRFCVHYWFTAFAFLSPPACIVIWFLLKRNGIRKTRWALLGIGLAISPVLLILAWLVFRPFLFR